MKYLLTFVLTLFFINSFSQDKKNKIKEIYIESVDLFGHKKNSFTVFDINNEPINKGNWEYDSINKNYIKTETYKILTEQEKNFTYLYDNNNNIISKTKFIEETKYLNNFVGFIKFYEVLHYNHNNKLHKTIRYNAEIDTLDAGREELNSDIVAFRLGSKKLSIEYLTYDLKKSFIQEFNDKEQLLWTIDLWNATGLEFFYDDFGNLVSYTKYNLNKIENLSIWMFYNYDLEGEVFRKENIEGEYTLKYKLDKFGNWIEKITYNSRFTTVDYYQKETRHIVYY